MQDRFCIQSKGKINVDFSSGYIASCDKLNYGCNGGYMYLVYDFLKKNGTITGGDYDSDSVNIFAHILNTVLHRI